MLVIDKKIQLIEDYEKAYHEMLVHVPMIMHPNPKRILIIGGGDGASVREVLKHSPDEIVMVEIDENVVRASKEYIGVDNGALDNPRLTLLYEDGVEYIKNTNEEFDVVIVDSTDPTPVSESLFTEEFYKKCSKITEYLSIQSQSPVLQQEDFIRVFKNTEVFADRKVYLSFVPMYPSGMWSFILASNRKIEFDVDELKRRYRERRLNTEYYTPEIHIASFVLPKWIKKLLV
jgi:spermidine synthase